MLMEVFKYPYSYYLKQKNLPRIHSYALYPPIKKHYETTLSLNKRFIMLKHIEKYLDRMKEVSSRHTFESAQTEVELPIDK
jgi:hypothetical protein